MAKKRTIEITINDYTFYLKNLKIHEDMSDETTCYSADLYCNGKKIAYCKNSGHGEDTSVCYYGDDPNYELAKEAFKAIYPVRDTEYEKEIIESMKKYTWFDSSRPYIQQFTADHLADRLMYKQASWDYAFARAAMLAKCYPTSKIFFDGTTMMASRDDAPPKEGFEDVTEWVR